LENWSILLNCFSWSRPTAVGRLSDSTSSLNRLPTFHVVDCWRSSVVVSALPSSDNRFGRSTSVDDDATDSTLSTAASRGSFLQHTLHSVSKKRCHFYIFKQISRNKMKIIKTG